MNVTYVSTSERIFGYIITITTTFTTITNKVLLVAFTRKSNSLRNPEIPIKAIACERCECTVNIFCLLLQSMKNSIF